MTLSDVKVCIKEVRSKCLAEENAHLLAEGVKSPELELQLTFWA